MSFSFGFRRNLTNRETMKAVSLLSLLEGCSFREGRRMFVFGILILVGDSFINHCLVYCWILLLLRSRFLMWYGGLGFLES